MKKKIIIQAIIFDRHTYTSAMCQKWLKKHNYVPIKRVHLTANYRRYRIAEPSTRKSTYFTKTVAPGIKLILMARYNEK